MKNLRKRYLFDLLVTSALLVFTILYCLFSQFSMKSSIVISLILITVPFIQDLYRIYKYIPKYVPEDVESDSEK